MNSDIKNTAGQSLIELIIAMAIFAVLAFSLGGTILSGMAGTQRSSQFLSANALIQESTEAVKDIAPNKWNELIYERSSVGAVSGEWVLSGEGTSEQIGVFSRVIDFSPVYRDSEGRIAALGTPGSYNDVLSRQVNVKVSWMKEGGAETSLTGTSQISAWSSVFWSQDAWDGGSGQEIWLLENGYESDDGKIDVLGGPITLAKASSTTYEISGALYSSAFDAGRESAFIALDWAGVWPEDCPACLVKIQIKTAKDNNGLPGEWPSTWCGPEGKDGDENDFFSVSKGELIHTDHNTDQWIKYRVLLYGDGENAPVVERVRVYYQ